MNPLTNMKNVTKLSEQELYTSNKTSWHDQYKDSAWIFIGGLPFDLTEGDIVCIFSQYGEVVNINLIRDKDSGKSKGFCFLCYEDQRSTVLAVDNFNGIKVLNRILRVDHVSNYKVPKDSKKLDTETRKLYEEGCAPRSSIPKVITSKENQDCRETLADQIEADIKLPTRLPILPVKIEPKSEESKQEKTREEKNSRKTSDYKDSKKDSKYKGKFDHYKRSDDYYKRVEKSDYRNKYSDERESESKEVKKKKVKKYNKSSKSESEYRNKSSHSDFKTKYRSGFDTEKHKSSRSEI